MKNCVKATLSDRKTVLHFHIVGGETDYDLFPYISNIIYLKYNCAAIYTVLPMEDDVKSFAVEKNNGVWCVDNRWGV